MFGCVELRSLFRIPVKRDRNRLIGITCDPSNNVVVNGRFIYLVQDNTIQVVARYALLGGKQDRKLNGIRTDCNPMSFHSA